MDDPLASMSHIMLHGEIQRLEIQRHSGALWMRKEGRDFLPALYKERKRRRDAVRADPYKRQFLSRA